MRHPRSKLLGVEVADTSEHAVATTPLADLSDLPRFAVVDVETSGLSERRHRLLQVAVVTIDHGAVVEEWSTLIKLRWPLGRVGPRRVHGISRASLRGAPRQSEALHQLAQRLDGAVFTAHHVRFDWSFIERAARRSKVSITPAHRLCTLRLSRSLDPERSRSHRLADVCGRYGITNDRPHDALHDARATAEALPYLLGAHGVTNPTQLDSLYERW